MLRASLYVTAVHTCGPSVRRSSFKGSTSLSLPHFQAYDIQSPGFCSSYLLSLTMQRFDVKRVRAAVWKWLCRCPDAIGPFGDMSSDDEFFTPPTSPLPCAEDVDAARFSASSTLTPSGDAHRLLSPAQTRRLQRRHAAVVSQLTTPPPVVAPRPQPPLKAYQRPIMVYRPSWAP